MIRTLQVISVVCIVAAAALLAVAALLLRPGHSGAVPAAGAPARAGLQGTDVWPSGQRPAPHFALHDQTGRLVTPAALRGQVWAMTFIDSRCTTQCPIVARALAHAQHQLGPKYPLKLVFVSVLPQWDTAPRVRAFARKEGLTTGWQWLLGNKKQLKPVWDAYGIWVVTGVEHTGAVYLVDTHGDVRVADGIPFVPDQFAASVRALTPAHRSHASA